MRRLVGILALLLIPGPAVLAQTPPPVVGVMSVPVRDVSPTTEFVGRVEAINAVDIRARVEGFVEQRPFNEGQVVRQGQDLFIIERTAFEAALAARQADVASAQATLLDAERRLQRNQELRRTQAVAQATLEDATTARDTAQASLKAAEANARQAELNLEYTSVKAPIAGRIGRAAVAVGSLVGPSSDPLARIVQSDPIRVVFSVNDRTVLQLRAEAPGVSKDELAGRFVPTLRLSNGEAYPEAGTLEFFGNEVDAQTGTIPIWARFPNPRFMLVPGQFVTVMVRRADTQRLPMVPIGAVEQDREGRFVLLVDAGNKVAMQRIRVTAQIDQNWVVEEGLNGGERLIIQGLQNARPGAAVEIVQTEDSSPATVQDGKAEEPGARAQSP